MRAFVPAVLFIAFYAALVYSFSYVKVFFGDPSDAGLLGVGGYAILLGIYLSIAGMAGAFALSLNGLRAASRFFLFGLFGVIILITLQILTTLFETLSQDTF